MIQERVVNMMWGEQIAGPASGYMPGNNNMRVSKSAPCSPIKPNSNGSAARVDLFHVVHKVPVGDSPYVKAKHVQLVDRDPDRAIGLFWAAINSGDRVDSALKDMAIVMKQQNRPQEAIEAIKSLRGRCSDQAQESLDNVLLDLFKRCGRLDDQIDLLKRKLHLIHQGMAFNGKRTKTARSQGKKFQVSVEQEATRLLGNLGWAYMQQSNFVAAEAVYRKALSIESDGNKICNLGICLMKQGRLEEAKSMLESVTLACHDTRWGSESHLKSFERAQEMLEELVERGYHDKVEKQLSSFAIPGCDTTDAGGSLWQPQPALPRQPRRIPRSTLELQLLSHVDPSMTGALLATSGFGPPPPDHTTRLDMAGSFRIPQPGAAMMHGERISSFQPQWWLQGGLEDDEYFDYSSPDESSDGSRDGSIDAQGCGQHDLMLENVTALENDTTQLGLKAEADTDLAGTELSPTVGDLARGLESVQPFNPIAVNESLNVHSTSTTTHGDAAISPGSDASDSGIHNDHHQVIVQDEVSRAVKLLPSAGMWTTTPFGSTHTVFANSWNRGDHDENQSTSTRSRRSLPLELGRIQVTESKAPPVLPYPQLVNNSIGLSPLHAAPGKQISRTTTTPVKDNDTTTVSPWDLMGFTYNPSDLDFGRANNDEIAPSKRESAVEHEGLTGNLSASEMEMRRQRRLRVFQEMTPSKTLQV